MLIIKNEFYDNQIIQNLFIAASAFLVSFFILAYFYWVSRPPMPFFQKFGKFVMDFPMFLSVSMGLSLHNAVAVIEGLTGKKSAFVRTPKFAISTGKKGSWTDKKYRAVKIAPLTFVEAFMVLYFATGLVLAFYYVDFGLFPFHFMLTLGYIFVTFYSFKHAKKA
jgi:hypothetical protein